MILLFCPSGCTLSFNFTLKSAFHSTEDWKSLYFDETGAIYVWNNIPCNVKTIHFSVKWGEN